MDNLIMGGIRMNIKKNGRFKNCYLRSNDVLRIDIEKYGRF